MEAVGRLAGGVAHDFNNLLTVILGNCELLMAMPPQEWDLESLASIQSAAVSASSLTTRLLTFSRRGVTKPQLLDLNDALGDTQSLLTRMLGDGVDLEMKLEAPEAIVKIDPIQLQQMVMNLAMNAKEAMPNGGELRVETGHSSDGDHVLLTVSDTGVGMTREILENIFEPFFTSRGSGRGTGLGLAVVHGIVNSFNGIIEVESKPEAGTTFKVAFPRCEPPQEPEGRHLSERPAGGDESILCVEDEEGVRKVAARSLRSAGYRVVTASLPSEALEIASSEQFDLLLTDVMMPEMTGRELAKILAERQPGLKILYMTGYTSDLELKEQLLEGEAELIHKPFAPRDLARAVRAVLDNETGEKSE